MRAVYLFLIFLLLLISSFEGVNACQYPPFGYVSVPPNVLIVLDNSGSMYELAYKKDEQYNQNNLYYGYFDPSSKYSYKKVSKKKGYFYKDPNGNWSGNYLNWLTMRRVDIMRKVLVGGDFYKSGNYYYLKVIDDPDRDFYRPGTNYVIAGGYLFEGNTLPPDLYFYKIDWNNHSVYFWDCSYGGRCYRVSWKFNNAYRLHIRTSQEPKGIIQETWNKVRYGLMTFNIGDGFEDRYDIKDGGKVEIFISGPGENNGLVKKIQSIKPRTWTPLAETYYEAIRYFEARMSAYNSIDYSNHDPIQYRCQKNFVLLITDGESTKDKDIPGGCWGADVSDSNFSIRSWMEKISQIEGKDLFCKKANSMDGTYYLAGVAFYAHDTDLRPDLKGEQNLTLYDVFVFDDSPVGRKLLRWAAKYGGFNDINDNGIPDLEAEWDSNEDGIPDNYFEAQDGYKIEAAIKKAVEEIIKRASGTSVAVLPETKKKGTFVTQSLFYPRKTVGKYDLTWVGYLYNWWLLNSKKIQNIREDTNQNAVLDILDDKIIEWQIDPYTYSLKITTYESKPDGTKGSASGTYSSFDELHPIWEGGKALLYMSPNDRRIFTNVNGDLVAFEKANLLNFEHYFGDLSKISCLKNDPKNLVDFIRGVQILGCRNITYDSDGDTWKLGDIVYSTPMLVSYDNMNVVFVGANDGMLHAFKVGYLKKQSDSMHPVKLQDSPNDSTHYTIGEELWAFIPENVLPYLKFLADPNYCHRYFVDLRPYVVDIKTDDGTKRRILIGGMRLGGGTGCSGDSCENPPPDTCPDVSSSQCVGLSSYFALDITNPERPLLLWEFSHKDLGLTYSGPAIIRKKSGIYVLFGSGPTNYKGDSGQKLTLFVLDLLTGKLKATYSRFVSSSVGKGQGAEIKNAFSGRLFTEGFDYDNDGDTDYVFFGYSRKNGNMKNWKGGLIMGDVRDENPENWRFYKYFNDAFGPVTAKVEIGKCFDRYYLYFGTGRWFFKDDDTLSGQRNRIYGIPLECDDNGCRPNVNAAHSSKDVCTDARNGVLRSWYVELEGGNDDYLKERVITDPTLTDQNVAIFTTIEPTTDPCGFGGRTRLWMLNCATGGSVNDKCPVYMVNKTQGTLLLQLSGSDLRQISINWKKGEGAPSNFSEENHRATSWYTGIAPESTTPFIGPYSALMGALLLWLEM